MGRFHPGGWHAYRLELRDESANLTGQIEFEAQGADNAFALAERQSRGSEVELFEDGRLLARLHSRKHGGFWTLAGPQSTATQDQAPLAGSGS